MNKTFFTVLRSEEKDWKKLYNFWLRLRVAHTDLGNCSRREIVRLIYFDLVASSSVRSSQWGMRNRSTERQSRLNSTCGFKLNHAKVISEFYKS